MSVMYEAIHVSAPAVMPARVRVEVIGRALRIGGAHYNVGERLKLDPTNPQHQQVLDAPGWVRRLDVVGVPVTDGAGKVALEEVVLTLKVETPKVAEMPVETSKAAEIPKAETPKTNVAVASAPAVPHEHKMIDRPTRRVQKP